MNKPAPVNQPGHKLAQMRPKLMAEKRGNENPFEHLVKATINPPRPKPTRTPTHPPSIISGR